MDFHVKMAREIDQAESRGGYDLLFFGDSISENWRGTSGDRSNPGARAIHDVWNKQFGGYNADVMAIAGDQIAHLHWRMLNGEMPRAHAPNASVVLIGTNDLYAAGACGPGSPEESITDAADATGERLKALISLMREQMPGTHIILLALLPRSWVRAGEWPSALTKGNEIINDRMQGLALTDDHVHYLDCGGAYLLPEGKGLNGELMPLPDPEIVITAGEIKEQEERKWQAALEMMVAQGSGF
ncbi:hypothetical protein WJX72_002408 [[Myrmecia] bisecta]|uniref:SGNH hydrolase-type esterase domain-containing protein n=1 Tax=[Myrmecia] bisecta TaxID=41462 RepID=A0AAW1Q4X9_9CHLO